jgi:hypothetical protein
MGKRSFHLPGPFAGLGAAPVVRRVIRPIARDEVERRFRERRWPPIILILVSLVLWAGIGLVVYHLLN